MLRSILLAALVLALVAAPASAQDTLPRRSLLGASASDAPSGGAQIVAVRPGSAAERASLQPSDVVTAIAGRSIANAREFRATVGASRADRATPFALTRDGQAQTLIVRLEEAPRENDPDIATIYGAVRVDGALRRTLLTSPRNTRGRLPAMLLIGGIGCYSIDDATLANDPYTRLAHDLGRRGIVVMRVEKSGVGDSQGPACAEVDFSAELSGYEAALTAMRAERRINPEQIFLFGHSIGTVGAPMLAAQQLVAGIIAAQGVGRTWIEYELINTRRQIELAGATPAETDGAMLAKSDCITRALVRREPVAELFEAEPVCRDLVSLPASQAYMSELAHLNIAEIWSAIDTPALVIYGSSDFVTDEADHRRLADIVNAAHPGRAELAIIPGMDHYLALADSMADSMARVSAGDAFGQFDARFSAKVGDWICAHAAC